MKLTEVTPAGTQTYSKAPSRFPPGAPAIAARASGPYVWDPAGRRYVDCVSALGAVILGHRDSDVDSAILHQLSHGTSFSLPTALEGEVAELVARLLPGVEMVRFLKNGGDACTAAVRLARAVTGRERVLTIGYHGRDDWTVADTNPAGVPACNRGRILVRLPYGDLAALERALRHEPSACLIMEPLVAYDPPADLSVVGPYLRACRELCTQHGALLIFDEVVTGFRMTGLSAAAAFGVTPDLYAAGKAMANGLPLSIVAGPRALMRRMAEDVFCSTTFGGETLALASAAATIRKLVECEVPAKLGRFGHDMTNALAGAAMGVGLADEVRAVGYPQRPVIQWRRPALRDAFGARMLGEGFLYQGYVNLTLAHQREVLLPEFRRAFQAACASAAALLGAPTQGPAMEVGPWR